MECPVGVVSICDEGDLVNSRKASGPLPGDLLQDLSGCWPELSGVMEDGAILVRPDGHVLWRCKQAVPEQSMLQMLRHAMQKCLCI